MKSSAAQKQEFFSEGTLVKIIDFYVNSDSGESHRLGINIQKIKEIVEFENLQALPKTYLPFIGVYNLREAPIPVIYLGSFFDNNKSTESVDLKRLKNSRIMICEFQRMLIGFIIDKTGKILTVPNSQLTPVPEALNFTEHRIFNGILRESGDFIHLLDVELILDSLNVDLGLGQTMSVETSYKGKKVLLVEDSKLFQKRLSQFFEKLEMEVVLAEDGMQGLKTLAEHNYQFDLIFSDIEMPHLNGIGMVRQIKTIGEADHIPIIFNTSISNPGLIEDIRREDLGEYIIKFDESEIFRALSRAFTNS